MVNKALKKIEDWLVFVFEFWCECWYELFGFILVWWVMHRYLSKDNVIDMCVVILCYYLPFFAHNGYFGGKLKQVVDRFYWT